MPWCDECARFLNPTSMSAKGECPSCGRVIAEPVDMKAPWHFKLLVAATVLYLGFRAYQGIAWLVQHA
jgi:uncharacterized paraquat-inducible protein A